jgi:hypothetical protein
MGDVQTCVAVTEVLKVVTQPFHVAAGGPSASAASAVLGAVGGSAAAAAAAAAAAGSGGSSGVGSEASGVGGAAGLGSRAVRLVDLVSSAGQRREWGWWYVEQLRALQKPLAANEVCARSDDEHLSRLNTNSTSVGGGGGGGGWTIGRAITRKQPLLLK